MNINQCNLSTGDVISGRYHVLDVLGEGAFGNVFLVMNENRRRYALKLLRLWEVHPEIRISLLNRFDMEYETGCIKSDYLVRSIDHGCLSGNPYIVMEYCSAGDLLQVLSRQTVDLTFVASHVLYGLRDLHQNGKVHRDLKPENVLLKDDGHYALTDFGIAGDRNKRMTERNILGKSKQMFGTYAYMPPEQLNKRRDATVLPTTDIFSFGVMMYQLLTKRLPFGPLESDGDLPSYIRHGRIGDWDRNSLLQTPEGISWQKLIEGCLEPDYTKRFQSVDDVLPSIPCPEGRSLYSEHCRSQNPAASGRIIHGVLLRVMQGEEFGKVYKLDDLLTSDHALITMGRRDAEHVNTINIKEMQSCYISRRHCTFELDYQSGQWIVRDGQWNSSAGWQRSTNGTFINSQEIDSYGLPFSPGDIISVGDVKLRAEAY